MSRRVVFLDRDGTINEEVSYLGSPERLVLVPGAAQAIAALNRAGWAVVVVTNQSGVARGLFTERDVAAVHEALAAALAAHGARIDAFYVCPHHPEFTGPCACRKPGTALYERAMRELHLLPDDALVVGDSSVDIEAGTALGMRTALVLTGHGATAAERLVAGEGPAPRFVAPSLADVVAWLLGGEDGPT